MTNYHPVNVALSAIGFVVMLVAIFVLPDGDFSFGLTLIALGWALRGVITQFLART